MKYLTISTCIKGENDYIDDYITINKHAGVEHFVFFDRDGFNLTNKFKWRDDITVIQYPEPNRHHESYVHIVKHFQNFSKWFAFIDCDQFLYSPVNDDIRVVLQDYEKYAQLQICWHTLGSGGLLKKEPGSVYERFTKRAKDDAYINAHTQALCDVSRMVPITPPDPHRLVVQKEYFSVDENHCLVENSPRIKPPTQNKICIPHYISKSLQEWQYKNSKGRADIPGEKMPFDLFNKHDEFCNEVEDLRFKEFWERANKK